MAAQTVSKKNFMTVATIGDMPNDVLMFEKSGLSIAMGNASGEVQYQARFVTSSNEEEGFANAMRHFVLAGRSRLREKAS
jgi:hydroxymethylpyrimidine pyrophosphatase-like HAD family hydrolase